MLDPVGCVFHTLAPPLSDRAALSVMSFLLRNSSGQELDDVVSALVDLWRFGDSAVANSKAMTQTDRIGSSPAAWWDQYYQIHKTLASSTAGDRQSGSMSDTLMRLAFGSEGCVSHTVCGFLGITCSSAVSTDDYLDAYCPHLPNFELDAGGVTAWLILDRELLSFAWCSGRSWALREMRRSSRSFGSSQPPAGSRAQCSLRSSSR